MRGLIALSLLVGAFGAGIGADFQPLQTPEADSVAAVQVVLFGPYSNLATKYLWQSLFNLHLDLGTSRLEVLAASRDTAEIGLGKIRHIIAANVTCPEVDDVTACQHVKQRFLAAAVSYYAISTEQGYSIFGDALVASEGGAGNRDQRLLSRILYMSVAPDVVEGILHRLAEYGKVMLPGISGAACPGCRMLRVPSKVLLEKPVGRDEVSATQLLRGIAAFVPPSDLYITDHYMAKAGLLAAAGLRAALHRRLGPESEAAAARPTNSTGLRAEVLARRLFTGLPASVLTVMLEAEDAAGRTSFYNDYGVIRDVMQNHVSLLALATLSGDAETWAPSGRLRSLRRWMPARRSAALFGHDGRLSGPAAAALQAIVAVGAYDGYPGHVLAEKAPAVREAVDKAKHAAETERAVACSKPGQTRDMGASAVADVISALSEVYTARKAEYQALHGGRSPAAREVFGEGFAGPTAASVALAVHTHDVSEGDAEGADAGFAGLRLVVGKALGVRSAFVRHCVSMPAQEAVGVDASGQLDGPAAPQTEGSVAGAADGCKLSVTYHLQGRVMLPASSPDRPPACGDGAVSTDECNEGVALSLRGYTGPAVIVSAQDPSVRASLPGLAEVLTQALLDGSALPQWAAWLAKWHVAEVDAQAGLLVLRPAPAPTTPLQGAAGATAAPPQGAEILRRLAVIGRTPGASSVDAYTMIMAAGLAGQAQAFVSPAEVERLWKVWGPIADAADVLVAAETTNSTMLAHAGFCGREQQRLGSFFVYTPGERAWLLTHEEASVVP